MVGAHASGHGGGEERSLHPVTIRLHAWMTIVVCLITSQWVEWWLFFIALASLITLGVRFYRASFGNSATAIQGPSVGYCRSTPRRMPRLVTPPRLQEVR